MTQKQRPKSYTASRGPPQGAHTPQKLGEEGWRLLAAFQRELSPAISCFWTLSLQDCERINSNGLRHFVTDAIRNKNTEVITFGTPRPPGAHVRSPGKTGSTEQGWPHGIRDPTTVPPRGSWANTCWNRSRLPALQVSLQCPQQLNRPRSQQQKSGSAATDGSGEGRSWAEDPEGELETRRRGSNPHPAVVSPLHARLGKTLKKWKELFSALWGLWLQEVTTTAGTHATKK